MHHNVRLHRGNSAMTSSLEGGCFHSELVTTSVSHKPQALNRLTRSVPTSGYKVSCTVSKLNEHIHFFNILLMCRGPIFLGKLEPLCLLFEIPSTFSSLVPAPSELFSPRAFTETPTYALQSYVAPTTSRSKGMDLRCPSDGLVR